jgi:hypothetical protein
MLVHDMELATTRSIDRLFRLSMVVVVAGIVMAALAVLALWARRDKAHRLASMNRGGGIAAPLDQSPIGTVT